MTYSLYNKKLFIGIISRITLLLQSYSLTLNSHLSLEAIMFF